jgi:hypothetical protein
MTGAADVRWRHGRWRGAIDLAAGVSPGPLVAAAMDPHGRRSRHARTRPLSGASSRPLWLKVYPAPGGRRAWRAWRMGKVLDAAGFDVPEAVLVGVRAGGGLLVTRDVGGRPLLDAVAALGRAEKRHLLRTLGRVVGALHAAGFVHGDLVPSNVHVRDGAVVLLDHDRTRRSRLVVWWGARRNLVQLGRFVAAGIGVADRLSVLCAYAERRGLSRRARRRLARWLVVKTTARRIAIDRLPAAAARAGYATLMRSGGPYDAAAGAAERP